jgi:hypothetical protein
VPSVYVNTAPYETLKDPSCDTSVTKSRPAAHVLLGVHGPVPVGAFAGGEPVVEEQLLAVLQPACGHQHQTENARPMHTRESVSAWSYLATADGVPKNTAGPCLGAPSWAW